MALSRLNTDIASHFFAHLASRYDLRPRLAEIEIPTLVITGRHDWVCPPAGGRAIANAVRDADLVELPDAGHFGFSETPRPFRAAVSAHIARIAAAQSMSESSGLRLAIRVRA